MTDDGSRELCGTTCATWPLYIQVLGANTYQARHGTAIQPGTLSKMHMRHHQCPDPRTTREKWLAAQQGLPIAQCSTCACICTWPATTSLLTIGLSPGETPNHMDASTPVTLHGGLDRYASTYKRKTCRTTTYWKDHCSRPTEQHTLHKHADLLDCSKEPDQSRLVIPALLLACLLCLHHG